MAISAVAQLAGSRPEPAPGAESSSHPRTRIRRCPRTRFSFRPPFLVVLILAATLGERSRPILQRLNETLDRASAFVMPVLLGLAGLALVADAVLYFTTGEGLF
jgi:hypothetical protein